MCLAIIIALSSESLAELSRSHPGHPAIAFQFRRASGFLNITSDSLSSCHARLTLGVRDISACKCTVPEIGSLPSTVALGRPAVESPPEDWTPRRSHIISSLSLHSYLPQRAIRLTCPDMVHATSAATVEEPKSMESSLQPKTAAALARFEFESGKGKDGSKVLMVEWDTTCTHEQREASPRLPDQESHPAGPVWKVSWEGMPVALPVRDRDERSRTQERQFFLLPPGCQFPGDITITHHTGLTVSAKPLPAIFPEGLGLDAGTKGVLRKFIYYPAPVKLSDPLNGKPALP